MVFLCPLGAAAEQVLDQAGPAHFAGKVLVDVTNPLDFGKGGYGSGPPGLFVGTTDSLGERLQRKVPQAHVVKAWNTVSNTVMLNPPKGARLFIAGDDAAAKKKVEELAKAHGWAGVLDTGGIDGARWLEATVPLWVRAGMALNRCDHVIDYK